MNNLGKTAVMCGLIVAGLHMCGRHSLYAQKRIDLTLESAVDIAMDNSYQVKQLQLGIERTRFNLQARRAGLKSRVYMNLQAPDLNSTSEFKWNSTLQMDEIVRQNTRRWQMDLSIRQPVILFGYPTNGYLSLNNKMYRYLQKQEGSTDVNYYNRYFIRFEQPILQPNILKNDIEQAELDLQSNELNYIDDLVEMIDDIADDYYDSFELSYRNIIYAHHVANLRHVSEIINTISRQDSSRSIDAIQVQVELANTQERLLGNQGNLRLEVARMIQRLRLDPQDSLIVEPVAEVIPITVDLNQAIEYGYTLRPRMQLLAINRRRNEINLQETKGWNAFNMNLEMTYGLEKQDERYQELWEGHDNSYSASVSAYIPIWDWGQRKANIEASKINIQQTDLSIEESKNSIKSEITNAVANLEEYQTRALNMKDNVEVVMDLSARSIKQFEGNIISVQDILRILDRQRETELNFLDAYLGYRRSLLRLLVNTHYDYEKNSSLLDLFRAQNENNNHSQKQYTQSFDSQDTFVKSNLKLGEF